MKYIVYILIAFGFWLLFTYSFAIENIVIGLVISILTVLFLGSHFIQDVGKLANPVRYFWLIIYIFIFSWECLKANLDVAYRVLHIKLPIKPGIVKVKTGLKTDVGRATLANSITMTPGTITIDIKGDTLFVHWLYMHSTDPEVYTTRIAGRFEKYIKKIFE